MTTGAPESRKREDARHQPRVLPIGALTEIFYGLAIVSGLDHAADVMTTGSGPFASYALATVGALCLALGDWAVYHVYVAPRSYNRITRVILDLVIIVALFAVFRAVTVPVVFAGAVLVYLALGSAYYLLLRAEHGTNPDAARMSLLQAALAVVTGGCLAWIVLDPSDATAGGLAVTGLCVVWSLVNLREAGKSLQTQTSSSDSTA